jgi:hypothetical protein
MLMSVLNKRIELGCGSWIRVHQNKRRRKVFTVEVHRGRGDGGLIKADSLGWARHGKIIVSRSAMADLVAVLTQLQLETK